MFACSEIGERMINRDPDITRLVDRLVAALQTITAEG
jgi:hypothetical protein